MTSEPFAWISPEEWARVREAARKARDEDGVRAIMVPVKVDVRMAYEDDLPLFVGEPELRAGDVPVGTCYPEPEPRQPWDPPPPTDVNGPGDQEGEQWKREP